MSRHANREQRRIENVGALREQNKKLIQKRSRIRRVQRRRPYLGPGGGNGFFNIDIGNPEKWIQQVNVETATIRQFQQNGPSQPREVGSNGVPLDWDYLTENVKDSPLGPWGEPLTGRAVGWLPTGEMDYGGGLNGWWMKTLDHLAGEVDLEEETPQVTDVVGNFFDLTGEAKEKRDKDIEAGVDVTKATTDQILSGFAGAFGAGIDLIKNFWRGLEGETAGSSPFAMPARIVGAAFNSAMVGLQAAAESIEERVIGPRLLAATEALIENELVDDATVQKWKESISPLHHFPVFFKTGVAWMSGQLKPSDFDIEERHELAARIAYTAWKNEAIKAEYISRVRAGEDPRLLAMELEDPISEALGEALWDPLNLLDLIGIGFTAVRWGSRVAGKINSLRAVKRVNAAYDTYRVASKTGDVAGMRKAEIAIVTAIQENYVRNVNAGTELAGKRGLFATLATSNQGVQEENIVGFYGHLMHQMNGKTDDLNNLMEAMILVNTAAPDSEEAIRGIKIFNELVRKYKGRLTKDVLFSDDGMQAMVIMKDVVTGADGVIDTARIPKLIAKAEKLAAAAEDGNVIEELGKLLRDDWVKILKKRFPTIDETVKQNKTWAKIVAEHGDESVEATRYLARHPAANVEPSKFLQRMVEPHNLAQKFFYRPVAKIQGTIFMGLNPAYMYRNRFGNFAATLVESGPKPAFRALAPRWLSKTFANNTDEVVAWLGHLPPGAERAIGGPAASFDPSQFSNKLGPITKLANEDERLTRIAIVMQEARKVVTKGIRTFLRGSDEFKQVFPDTSDRKLFERLWVSHKGDLSAARAEFSQVRGTGMHYVLDQFTDVDFDMLADLGGRAQGGGENLVWAIIRDEEMDVAEKIRHLDEFYEDYIQMGLKTANEPALHRVGPHSEDVDAIMAGLGGDEGIRQGDLAHRQLQSHRSWEEKGAEEWREAKDKLGTQLHHDLQKSQIGLNKGQEGVEQATNVAQDIIHTIDRNILDGNKTKGFRGIRQVTKEAEDFTDAVRTKAWKWTDSINESGGVTIETLVRWWEKGLDGVTPLGPKIVDGQINAKMVKDALWEQYRSLTTNKWHSTRQENVSIYQRGVDLLAAQLRSDVIKETGQAVSDFIGLKGTLRAKTNRHGVRAELMQRATLDPETSRLFVSAGQSEMRDILTDNFGRIIKARNRTDARDGINRFSNNLDRLKDDVARGNTSIDEAIDAMSGDMKDAFRDIQGPFWKDLARYMLEEPVAGDLTSTLRTALQKGSDAVKGIADEALNSDAIMARLNQLNPEGDWSFVGGSKKLVLQSNDNTIVKIGRSADNQPVHPNVMRPLHQEFVDNLSYEVYESVITNRLTPGAVTPNDAQIVKNALKDSGWDVADVGLDNVGKLEDGTPVMFDTTGVIPPAGSKIEAGVQRQIPVTGEGLRTFVDDLTDAVTVKPEIHTGLIEGPEGGLGLARIDPVRGPVPAGAAEGVEGPIEGFTITLTDELLNQTPEVIKESLAHEFSHVAEILPGGPEVLTDNFDGDFESFVRAILHDAGVKQELKPTAAQLKAVRKLMEDNPELAAPIKQILGSDLKKPSQIEALGRLEDVKDIENAQLTRLKRLENTRTRVKGPHPTVEDEFQETLTQVLDELEAHGLDISKLRDKPKDAVDALRRVRKETGNTLDDLRPQVLETPEEAFAKAQAQIKEGGSLEGLNTEYEIPLVAGADSGTPSPNRFANGSAPAVRDMIDRIKTILGSEGGGQRQVLDAATETRIDAWQVDAESQLSVIRKVASDIATAKADTALHNYGKRYGVDLVAAYVFPYQFWYSRSYIKWMKRAIQHPSMAANYARYKDTLATIHSGLPDWWKFQLNTNELLGLDSENPLYFNLEALLNPLHGLTGVDFSDPKRRVDWWGRTMEDVNKFGPSVWAPYQLALATHYSIQGNKEAAARWAGRILPFSRSFRDVTALMDPEGLGVEIDPYVHLFGGGIEAYERGRVGRQLGRLSLEEGMSKADIIDAGWKQEGEVWDRARALTISERAPTLVMALAPFLFGAGAKPRNIDDLQIDRMYASINGLILQKDLMSEEEYRKGWDELRQQYPQMDPILLAKKSGIERDEALAWNVLNRIPPGMLGAIAKEVGVQKSDLTRFYESKGDLTEMTEPQRLRFMGAVLEVAGLLEIPDDATRTEWQAARNLFNKMRDLGEETFGEGIWELVDLWFAIRDPEDPDAGRNFLRANPVVSQILDWQNVIIQNTQLMAPYYTSDERIRTFYKQQLYQTAENLYGEDLWDLFQVYNDLKDRGETKAARAFWKDTPQLGLYMDLRDETLPKIDEKVEHFGSIIPEAKPPLYRHEEEGPSDIVPQSFNVDKRQAFIDDLVRNYSNAYTNTSGQRKNITEGIRKLADRIFPGTRAQSNHYYKLLDAQKLEAATDYVSKRPKLEARVAWEYDRIQTSEQIVAGRLYKAAGREGFDEEPAEMPPQQVEAVEGPLGRLLEDLDGLPEHLQDAYGTRDTPGGV